MVNKTCGEEEDVEEEEVVGGNQFVCTSNLIPSVSHFALHVQLISAICQKHMHSKCLTVCCSPPPGRSLQLR